MLILTLLFISLKVQTISTSPFVVRDLAHNNLYSLLTTFPSSLKLETIHRQYPLPCSPVSISDSLRTQPVTGTVFQVHPHASAYGVVCICIRKHTINAMTWTGVAYYQFIEEIHSACDKFPKRERQAYSDHMHGKYYDSLLPHQTSVLDPFRSEESFLYFGTEEQTRFIYKCTKIPFTQDIHYRLIDPFPDSVCNSVPCLINYHSIFYSTEFNKDNHQCLLFQLKSMSGILMIDPQQSNSTMIFTSDAHARDLTFDIERTPQPECRDTGGEPIYMSKEGVYVSFGIRQDGVDPLLRLIQDSRNTSRSRRSRRTTHTIPIIPVDISKSVTFDLVPISQQNQWLFTRVTTDESALLHIMRKNIQNTITDLISIKHLQCIMQRRMDLNSYYLVKQFPMPYLKSILPEHSFRIHSREPLVIQKGVRMLFKVSSLGSNLTINDENDLNVVISGRNCTVQNITGNRNFQMWSRA